MAAESLDLLRELRELKPTVVHFNGHRGHGLEALSHSSTRTKASMPSPISWFAVCRTPGGSIALSRNNRRTKMRRARSCGAGFVCAVLWVIMAASCTLATPHPAPLPRSAAATGSAATTGAAATTATVPETPSSVDPPHQTRGVDIIVRSEPPPREPSATLPSAPPAASSDAAATPPRSTDSDPASQPSAFAGIGMWAFEGQPDEMISASVHRGLGPSAEGIAINLLGRRSALAFLIVGYHGPGSYMLVGGSRCAIRAVSDPRQLDPNTMSPDDPGMRAAMGSLLVTQDSEGRLSGLITLRQVDGRFDIPVNRPDQRLAP